MRSFLSAVLLFAVFSIISCTKTNNVTTTLHDTTTLVHNDTTVIKDTVWEKSIKNPIVGLWVGTYQLIGVVPVDSFYYSLDIQANGQVITTAIGATNNSDATAGSWLLNGTTFTANVTLLTNTTPAAAQALTAVYDSTAGTLVGQWTFTVGSGGNGSFRLFRVP